MVSDQARDEQLALTRAEVTELRGELARVREQLARAQEENEAAKVRVEAYAHLSHEIRTLLNGVIGITSLLLDTELSVEQRDYGKRIRTSGDALLGLLNDVLDFSKLEAKKCELERVDFDLQRTIDEVGELFAERAFTRGIELVIIAPASGFREEGPRLPTQLRGDPARLRQVLINLVSNAIKFTDHGEVVLEVALLPAPPAGEASGAGECLEPSEVLVRFEVRDTGVGIEKEGIGRLFQPFSQVHDPARGYGGTGLGLAFAKRLVEAMGGTIGVESTPGKGSTFWFTARLGDPVTTPKESPRPPPELSGRRVLVAAANAASRSYVGALLTAVGAFHVLAGSGAAALRLLEEGAAAGKPFDAVLLDPTLEDMNGGALARAFDGDPHLPRARLVAMTYPGQRLEVPEGRLAAHVAKPVRRTELIASLSAALDGPPSTRGRPEAHARYHSRGGGGSARVGEARPRVLLVEDNAVNQRVALMMVQKRGYDVDVASNGLEAIESTARSAYDAVLMDCQMPKLDGFSATAHIRAREGAGKRTPIIAMTANAGPGAREKCLAAGMDDYVSKPVSAEELDRVLNRWAPRRPVRRETPPEGFTKRSLSPEALKPPAVPSFGTLGPTPSSSAPAPTAPSAGAPSGSNRVTPPDMALPFSAAPGRTRPTLPAPASPPPPGPAGVIDRAALDKLRAMRRPSEPDLAVEVIELFLDDAPARLGALREAVAQGDLLRASRVAHTLKGSASHLGAKLLSTLCSRLEEKVRAGAPFNSAFTVSSIEEELGRVSAALLEEVKRARGTG